MPTALIIVFDSMLLFTIVPFFMAIAGDVKSRAFSTMTDVLKKVATHPFNVATALGMIATATHTHPPAAVERPQCRRHTGHRGILVIHLREPGLGEEPLGKVL